MGKGLFSSEVGGQADLFSMFGIAPEKPEPSEAEDVSLDEDMDEDTDAATDDEGEGGKEPAAPAKKKAPAKPAAKKDLTGPVTVKGCGWSTEYGDAGAKYSGEDVAKGLYDLGYKEVVAATLKYKDNVFYVLTQGEGKASDDTLSTKGGVTLILGQAACSLSAEQCGVEEEDFSLFDACEKFASIVPEFEGCALKFKAAAGVAVPVFSKKADVAKLDPNKEYQLWNSDGMKSLTGADISAFYQGYVLYESDKGILFPQPDVEKGAHVTTLDVKALGLKDTKEKKVEERYRLPVKICLSNYNQVMEVTSEQFGGREYIMKDDVLNYLRPMYRAFRSSTRKFDLCYNKPSGELAVSIISGEKGASASFFLVGEDKGVRVERTPLGVFKGTTDETGEVTALDFKFQMPKIPGGLLDAIIAYFRKDLTREAMVQVYHNKDRGYYLSYPEQDTTKVRVSYKLEPKPDTLVMTVHSHNTMSARFSAIDDEDECYTGIFGVIGRLGRNAIAEVNFRAGMEGCFKPLYAGDLFGGDVA